MFVTIALEKEGGLGEVVILDCVAVDLFVTCMVSVISPPVPREAGVASKEASSALLVHVGRLPEREKPPCASTVTVVSVSPATSAAAESGKTVILKTSLPPGPIWLADEPFEHAPEPCLKANTMVWVVTLLTHQPSGGSVDELMLYFVTSTVKVICRISLPALLLVTVKGSTALGSCMATSVPAGSVTVYVSAAKAGSAVSAKKSAITNTDEAEAPAAKRPTRAFRKTPDPNRILSKAAS